MRRVLRLLLISLVYWLPLVTVVVPLAGLTAVTVQQNYRLTANDPQQALAIDTRNALDRGQSSPLPTYLPTVDIASSQSPWVAIYDRQLNLVQSSATLHGGTPVMPSGVFATADQRGQYNVTWMPEAGVRSALVILPWQNGYVVSGRSLKAVEEREDGLMTMVVLATVATLGASYGSLVLVRIVAPRLSEQH